MPLKIASNNPGVVWNGSFFVHHSLALVNRELALALLDSRDFADRFDLTIEEYEPAAFGPDGDPRLERLARRIGAPCAAPRVTVRHHWPPNLERPAAGKLAVI